ncbi:MAG: DUF411 domain-containing protein [Rubricoccaceae bacterium]
MRALALLLVAALALAACRPGTDHAAHDAPPADTRATPAPDPSLPVLTVYATPQCGCCRLWVHHMEDEGFRVKTEYVESLAPVKTEYGIPDTLSACHTGVVDGYIIEGHVPAGAVKRLLAERPEGAAGLSVPGMPVGSPGMEAEGVAPDTYDVLLVARGEARPFARYEGVQLLP